MVPPTCAEEDGQRPSRRTITIRGETTRGRLRMRTAVSTRGNQRILHQLDTRNALLEVLDHHQVMAFSQQAVVNDDLSVVRDRQSEHADGPRIVLECRGPGPGRPLRQGAASDWIRPILIPGHRPRNRDQGTQWPIRRRTRRSGAAGLRPTARSRRLLSRPSRSSSFHRLTRGPPIHSPSEVSCCFRPSAR